MVKSLLYFDSRVHTLLHLSSFSSLKSLLHFISTVVEENVVSTEADKGGE